MNNNDRAVDAMNNGIEFVERAAPGIPGTNRLHLYAKDKGGLPTLYFINDVGTDYEISERVGGFAFSYPGNLAVGTSVTPILIALRTLMLTKAYANLKTAPTGSSVIIDINKNGSSLWSTTQANRLTISATETTGTQTAFDVVTLVEGDILTIDIDQIGSTIPGTDLTVTLKGK